MPRLQPPSRMTDSAHKFDSLPHMLDEKASCFSAGTLLSAASQKLAALIYSLAPHCQIGQFVEQDQQLLPAYPGEAP